MLTTMLTMLLALALMGAGLFILMQLRKDRSPLFMETIERGHDRLDRIIRDELNNIRTDEAENYRQTRQEVTQEIKEMKEVLDKKVAEQIYEQRSNLESLSLRMGQITQDSEGRIELVRQTIEDKLHKIQEDNAKHIEAVRQTVDEKLQVTLERRLGESFRQVSEQLEQVHQGLGDMRNLATGVGDLKKIFSNVKLRGTWGEVQLESLLNEILSPGQYEKNVRMGDQVVEFAIRLPGSQEGEVVFLPVDAKFPLEDYLRMTEAQESGEGDKAQEASKALEGRLKNAAKDIATKYLRPPQTTDFGILYLPVEGLYAEIVRRSDLISFFQREYRVLVAGPSTFAALLNSLQIGFRTLAIQKRTSEVWQILSTIKTEFGKFGDVLEGVKKKLEQATSTMDDALTRSRVIQRKLHQVQEGETPVLEEKEFPVWKEEKDEQSATEEVTVAEEEKNETPATEEGLVAEEENDEQSVVEEVTVAEEEKVETPVVEEVTVAEEEKDETPATEETTVSEEENDEQSVVEEVTVAEEEKNEQPATEETPVIEEENDEQSVAEEVTVAEEEKNESPATEEGPVAEEGKNEPPVTEEAPVAEEEKDETPAAEEVTVAEEEKNETPAAEEVTVAEEEKTETPVVEEAPVTEEEKKKQSAKETHSLEDDPAWFL